MNCVIQLFHVGVERQNHERQIGIDNADMYREFGVHQTDGPIDQSEINQNIVDRALIGKKTHPGINSQQKGCPKGQDDQHEEHEACCRC